MSETAFPLPIQARKPVEVIEGARPARLGSVIWAVLLGALTMAVLGSGALLDWASALPVGSISDFIVDLAGRWHDLMTQWGLSRLAEALRQAERAFQALRW